MSLDINLTGVEKTSNKKTTLTDNSDTFYPTQKAVKTAVDAKENTITAGTTAQYFRGDKTFQTLDKTAVGLSNVDNTSDANKPVSTATQTALNAKFNTPTGTTAQYLRGDGTVATFPTIPDPSDFVEKSDFTAHSILAKQSGASDPVAVSIGNNEILGRKSGGGSNIEGLSVSEVKSLLNYTASDVGAVATNSPITAGTYHKVTVDEKGLVTSGSVSYQMLFGNPNLSIGGSLTRHFSFSEGVASNSAINRYIPFIQDVTVSRLFITTITAQPSGGSSVFTIQKNGVDTGIVITIPAGSSAGSYSEIVTTASFNAGDNISIKWGNNSASTSCVVAGVSIGFL